IETHFYPSANGVPITASPGQFETNPMMLQLLVVSQQERRTVYLRHDHIRIAIAIDICKSRAASDNGLENVRPAFLGRHRNESNPFAGAMIPKQLRGLAILLAFLGFADIGIQMAIGR